MGRSVARRGRHNFGGAVDDRKIDYRILGSFEVRVGGRLVRLGGEKPRAPALGNQGRGDRTRRAPSKPVCMEVANKCPTALP